ncbi:uncharacterized protein LOC133875409 isoform X1 [Alnus glutinosa]|uniref:uncharacterized protein LOC133875409 isoform X1 n=1 Tax=Alnus glutinosa TaxID=3517 RepID=UPI002D79B516|nr:uncharacterized protein LOC133875409 isoform X1 [Alnus glutinosa]
MSCFPAKVMATVIVAVYLLVGDIPATSASLPYGGRKSLWLDGSTKTVPRLQGSFEGLNVSNKKIVSFRSLRVGGIWLPPPPVRNKSLKPRYSPKPPHTPEPAPPPQPPPPPQIL